MNVDKILEKYAELVIRTGLTIQPGQTLVIGSEAAPVDLQCAPLVRKLVKKAYEAGAKYVMVNWEDRATEKIYIELAPEETLDDYPTWRVKWMMEIAEQGGAFLTVQAPDPEALQGVNLDRMQRALKAKRSAIGELVAFFSNMKAPWCVICMPTVAWAKKVFPELPDEEALNKLWEHVAYILRLDQEDAKQAWEEHLVRLGEKTKYLNDARFHKLHFKGPGTDLTIELPERQVWISLAGTKDPKGVPFLPNMPSEEVFSAPVKTGVNGVVRSTLPLSYQGTLIENFSLRFENGKVVEATAEKGQEALQMLLETDAGASYLGEVALVPVDSPLSQLGVLFYNTLYDENASVHLALGNAYAFCLEGGTEMSKEQLEQNGLNTSLAHADFMIGSAEMDIDGITASGEVVPVFRGGNWATK